MKKIYFLSLIYLLSIFLSSCHKLYGPESYINSKNDTGLKIPSPLTSQNISHFYDLPQQTYPIIVPKTKFES